jgi:amino acid transporter
MPQPEPPPSERRRDGRQRNTPARLLAAVLIITAASLLGAVLGAGAVPAGAAVTAQGTGTTTTTTTPFNGNSAVKGHKEGPVAVVLSFIGVIAVVVLIVTLGSVSVRRRTRGNPTPNWWKGRGPPDRPNGLFGR